MQTAVDTKHHLIVTHEVTNVGADRSQLASVAKEAKAMLDLVRAGNVPPIPVSTRPLPST